MIRLKFRSFNQDMEKKNIFNDSMVDTSKCSVSVLISVAAEHHTRFYGWLRGWVDHPKKQVSVANHWDEDKC